MSDLLTRAQVDLLARTLGHPVERLAFLEKLGAADLRRLRDRMSGVLFDEQGEHFERVAPLANLVPPAIIGPAVEKVTPPLLAGRAAGVFARKLALKKIIAFLDKFSVTFMADVAPYIDPRSVAHLAPDFPVDTLVAVAKEMLRRGEYAAGSQFLGYGTVPQIKALEAAIGPDDYEGVVRTAFYIEESADLERILNNISPSTTVDLVRTLVEGTDELRLLGLALLARLDAGVSRRLGDIVFDDLGEDAVGTLVDTAVREGGERDLLATVANLSPSSLDMLAVNVTLAETLDAVVRAAAETDSWAGLLAVAERMSTDLQSRVVDVLLGLDGAATRLTGTGTRGHLWPMLLKILSGQGAEVQERFASAWGDRRPDDVATARQHATDLGLTEALGPLLSAL